MAEYESADPSEPCDVHGWADRKRCKARAENPYDWDPAYAARAVAELRDECATLRVELAAANGLADEWKQNCLIAAAQRNAAHGRFDMLKTDMRILRTDLTEALALLGHFADHEDAPCRLDHHGACQEHGGSSLRPCDIAAARKLLARARPTEAESEGAE